MRHSTGNRTKAEQVRFDAMKEQGVCIACLLRGTKPYGNYVEIHHFLSGNRRIGHMATVALCLWHHKGEPPEGKTSSEMREVYGPSFHKSTKPFRTEFGTDAEMLELQNNILGNT